MVKWDVSANGPPSLRTGGWCRDDEAPLLPLAPLWLLEALEVSADFCRPKNGNDLVMAGDLVDAEEVDRDTPGTSVGSLLTNLNSS